MKRGFLEMFLDDCKYYDPERKEIKALLKAVPMKGKTILDIGAGIGRLAFPLSTSAKEIVALDHDHRLRAYYKKYRRKNILFMNKNVEAYLGRRRIFDIFLLAWPTLDFRFVRLIKENMHQKSLLIFITCDDHSDYECIVDRLGMDFSHATKKKSMFLKNLANRFFVVQKKSIKTRYVYPEKGIAFRIIRNSLLLWYHLKLDAAGEEKLQKIISRHQKAEGVVFGEKVWLYILRKKGGKNASSVD